MTIANRKWTLAMAAVLLLTWAIAGFANAGEFIMGGPPTVFGVAATLVAVCTWLVTSGLAGLRSAGGFVRLATAFWSVVAVGAPVVLWTLTMAPGRTVSQGGWVLPLLLFALMAPLYGLYAFLPAWEPIVQAAAISVTAFAMTLIAYFSGRRIRGRAGEEVPSNQAS